MSTGFIVRISHRPIRFPKLGVPILYECVASDEDATVFESREAAINALQKRQMSLDRVAVVEKPK